MKSAYLAAVAVMALGASAGSHHARGAHAQLHNRNQVLNPRGGYYPATNATRPCDCGEYTVWVTNYGEATLYVPMPPPPPPATTIVSTSTLSALTTATTWLPVSYAPVISASPAPTPMVTNCPTPGVYTIPATTLTVTETATVCAATTTKAPAGTCTLGGVTTVVEQATTVVCPYAAVTTYDNVVTSTVLTTTYVCPSAGTYTIAPITTYVPTETIIVYPVVTTYVPGVYCQPEVVTTITEIDVVVICPVTPVVAPTAPAYVAPVPVVVTNSPAPAVASSSSVSAVVAVATSAAPVSSSAPASVGGSGNKWTMAYTPYTQSGQCKSASDVLTDLKAIKAAGFTTVRLYATDCSGLQNVGAACEAVGLKLIIGVFIEGSGIAGAQVQVTEIISWAKWELVVLIVVGNEAILNGHATPGELASFISSCKSSFSGAGYTGPVTTTEPLNILQQYSSLFCPVVDVVGCNIHPFFNGDVTAENAGSFVAQEMSIVEGLCPGKSAVNLETGWPSGGTCNNKACPSPENQRIAVEGILSACGGQSVIFSFVDDLWKVPGQFNCEQNWGVIHLWQN